MVAIWPIFLLLNFGVLYASNFNIILSRVCSWRICGPKGVSSAVVVPIERDSIIEEMSSLHRLHPDLIVDFNDIPAENVDNLLSFDPRNKNKLFEQIDKFKISKNDRLSHLCFDLLNYVTEYLDLNSNLNLRTSNRKFLINQLETSRFKLYNIISSKITCGFDCCHKSTLSASYLNRLIRPLHHLLSKEHQISTGFYYNIRPYRSLNLGLMDDVEEIEKKLDEVTKFNEFLALSLNFYHKTDLKAFWELI